MRAFAVSACLAACVLLAPGTAGAVSYYVGPTGIDTNADGRGLSPEKPWRTIAFAVCGGWSSCPVMTVNSSPVKDDDHLFLMAGTYLEHSIVLEHSGLSPQQPLTIRPYGDGPVIIDGEFEAPILRLGATGPVKNVLIEGITFRFGLLAGIYIGEGFPTENIVIQDCFVDRTKQSDNTGGIVASGYSKNVTISRCVVVGDGTTNGNYAGLFIHGSDGSVTVTNCDISRAAVGILYKYTSDGTHRSVISNNFIHDNTGSGIGANSDNVLIENNLVVNNVGNGIYLFSRSGMDGGRNCRVEHNTVYNHQYTIVIGYNGPGETGRFTGDYGGMHDTVVNNVFYGANGEVGSYTVWSYAPPDVFESQNPDNESDFNCYFNTATDKVMFAHGSAYAIDDWRRAYPDLDADSVVGEPAFVGADRLTAIEDFALAPGPGHRAASDQRDMGVDVTAVGIGGTTPAPAPVPSGGAKGSGCNHGGGGAAAPASVLALWVMALAGGRKTVPARRRLHRA